MYESNLTRQRPNELKALAPALVSSLIVWAGVGFLHGLIDHELAKRIVNVFFGGWQLGVIQLVTYCAFFWAMFLLLTKKLNIRNENQGFELELLNIQFAEQLLTEEDVHLLRERIVHLPKSHQSLHLVKLLRSIANSRFRSNASLVELTALLKEYIDIALTQMDTSYSTIRYLAWAVPSLGFIGTVIGIAGAMEQANEDIEVVTGLLGVAFDTTLVALLLSLIMMFFIHRTQETEENQLLAIQSYCLENFINRIMSSSK